MGKIPRLVQEMQPRMARGVAQICNAPASDQFGFGAIAVEHADPFHAVVLRADHVVAAVADHDRLARIDGGRLQRVGQQIGFVDAGAVELGTEHVFEMTAQAEMVDDALGKNVRLAGGDEQPVAGLRAPPGPRAMPA